MTGRISVDGAAVVEPEGVNHEGGGATFESIRHRLLLFSVSAFQLKRRIDE